MQHLFLYYANYFMKRHVGRPKVAKSRAKAPGISVRLTPDERAVIDKAILVSGLKTSDFARKALLQAATGGIGKL
jgi:uncharacterized protein (DUF1778 family)